MKKFSIVAFAAAAFVFATSCATRTHNETEAAAEAVNMNFVCKTDPNGPMQHTITITVTGSKLLVQQSATNAFFGPIEYQIKEQVMLAVMPTAPVAFDCTKGNKTLKIWDDVIAIGSAYYRLTKVSALHAAGPNLTCSYTVNEAAKHVATLTVSNNVLNIQQASPTARFAPIVWKLSPVNLKQDPLDPLKFSCRNNMANIRVWSSFGFVNGQYFILGP